MGKVNKLYEVVIGEYKTDIVAGQKGVNGEQLTPDSEKVTYNERVDIKNVVAADVAEAISKVSLGANQHVEAVNRLNVVDAV